MRSLRVTALVAAALLWGCTSNPDKHTIAELRNVQPDVDDVEVQDGLETAMQSYRRFLEETPETLMTAEAMRRLADLKLEKEYGIHGDAKPVEVAAPEAG